MTLNGCAALGVRDLNLKVAVSRKRCEIGPRLQLISNRKSYTGFDWHRNQWPWMTLSTGIEVFFGFYICSQWAFIHALLSRVPFALAGLSCFTFLTLCVNAFLHLIRKFVYMVLFIALKNITEVLYSLLWLRVRRVASSLAGYGHGRRVVRSLAARPRVSV